ncbi:MAG TPA: hypothetical protein DEF51_41720, partial [Myxococcales bacterium]|nr:hypothetical protein [Myxococcales bacterium]
MVIDPDEARGAQMASRLAEAGAETRSVVVDEASIQASRALDPSLVIVAAEALVEPGCSPLWEDIRLSSAPLLVLGEAFLAHAGTESLFGLVASLCMSELTLRKKLRHEEAVAERLETLGTARWLKLLGKCGHPVSFRVFAAAGRGRVDLSDGKIRGASFHPAARGKTIEGRAAIQTLLGLPFGRVLAGPPDALGRLDGVRRARRRPSIVGKITTTPSDGVRRRGLVRDEVVVKRTDATGLRRPVAIPKPVAPAPESNWLDDDDDEPTRSYEPSAVEKLREQLRLTEEEAAGLAQAAPRGSGPESASRSESTSESASASASASESASA